MKRFTKPTIKWAEFENLVPPQQWDKYLAFRAKNQAYLMRVNENPPKPPPLDWNRYRKEVPVKGLVDDFKKKYDALTIPFPTDTMSSKVDAQWKELQPAIDKYCAEMDTLIKKATDEIARISGLPPIEAMTMEMAMEHYPEYVVNPMKKPTLWPHGPEDQPDVK